MVQRTVTATLYSVILIFCLPDNPDYTQTDHRDERNSIIPKRLTIRTENDNLILESYRNRNITFSGLGGYVSFVIEPNFCLSDNLDYTQTDHRDERNSIIPKRLTTRIENDNISLESYRNRNITFFGLGGYVSFVIKTNFIYQEMGKCKSQADNSPPRKRTNSEQSVISLSSVDFELLESEEEADLLNNTILNVSPSKDFMDISLAFLFAEEDSSNQNEQPQSSKAPHTHDETGSSKKQKAQSTGIPTSPNETNLATKVPAPLAQDKTKSDNYNTGTTTIAPHEDRFFTVPMHIDQNEPNQQTSRSVDAPHEDRFFTAPTHIEQNEPNQQISRPLDAPRDDSLSKALSPQTREESGSPYKPKSQLHRTVPALQENYLTAEAPAPLPEITPGTPDMQNHATTSTPAVPPVNNNTTESQSPGHQGQVYNIFLFRKDLKVVGKEEWNGISEELLLAQVLKGAMLDISRSSFNRERRAHQVRTSTREEAIQITELIMETLAEETYTTYCANLDHLLLKNRVMTIIPHKFLKYLEQGLLLTLLKIGSASFRNTSEFEKHVKVPCPPKLLNNEQNAPRLSIVYEISDTYKLWLSSQDYKIKLIAKTLRFKLLADMKWKKDAVGLDILENLAITE